MEGVHFFCLKGVHWGKGGSDFYPQGGHIFRFVSINTTLAKKREWLLPFPLFEWWRDLKIKHKAPGEPCSPGRAPATQ